MRLLIDTQALIWFLINDKRLSPKAKEHMENPQNDLLVSIASLWEIAIKINIGKLRLEVPFKELEKRLNDIDISIAPLAFSYLNNLLNLPLNHKDPFDRLIIAQAITEDIPIVSSDGHFAQYPIKVVW